MSFETQIASVLKIEGGYSNNPNDAGGETNFGITVAVARAFGFTKPMSEMERADALLIYRKRYWDTQCLDEIEKLSPLIAAELLDTGVNLGVQEAGTFLQRALNVLNRQGKLYPDIKMDGRIGAMTVAALREFLEARGVNGQVVMLRLLNDQQGVHYIERAEARPANEEFVYGWGLNRLGTGD